MSELEGARCVGQWWLFDSTDLRDHAVARQLCEGCPAIEACRGLLKDSTNSLRYSGGGPAGTWAGKLIGGKEKRVPHGSEAGFQVHRHRRELPCDGCSAAHVEHWQGVRAEDQQEAS